MWEMAQICGKALKYVGNDLDTWQKAYEKRLKYFRNLLDVWETA